MIRLRHEQPGGIELKVINEQPLRIELWIDGNIEDVEITIEMTEQWIDRLERVMHFMRGTYLAPTREREQLTIRR